MSSPERDRDPIEGRGGAGGESEGEPGERFRHSPVVRVFFYYFAVLLLVSFGIQLLILYTFGEPAIEKLAKGERGVVPVTHLLLFQAVLLPLVIFITAFFTRSRDGKTLREIGLTWPAGTFKTLVLGAVLSAGLLGLWRLVAGQVLTFEKVVAGAEAAVPWQPVAATSLGLLALGLLASSIFDEVIFRGYLYSTLRERFPWVHAAGLTNLLYLTFHAGTPDAGAVAMINVFLTGLVLAGLRERSGSIAAGVVFQTVWNLVLGSFLSQRLSGYDFPRLENLRLAGNPELSGGEYGPEGGWLITGALLLGLVAVVAWVEQGRGEPEGAGDDVAPAG